MNYKDEEPRILEELGLVLPRADGPPLHCHLGFTEDLEVLEVRLELPIGGNKTKPLFEVCGQL
jgi:hypothetical protein